MSGTEQTTTEKGERNEREAANILGRVYGRGNVDKVSRYSNNDPLRFIDVLAAKNGWPVRFVQVKTNGFREMDKKKYASTVRKFPDSVVCEVWVRVDRQGWRIYRYDREDGFWRKVLKMDTCEEEETVETFREEVGYYDDQQSLHTDSDREDTSMEGSQ